MAAQVTYTSGSRSAGLLAHISADQGAESSEHWHSTGSYPLLFIFFPLFTQSRSPVYEIPTLWMGPLLSQYSLEMRSKTFPGARFLSVSKSSQDSGSILPSAFLVLDTPQAWLTRSIYPSQGEPTLGRRLPYVSPYSTHLLYGCLLLQATIPSCPRARTKHLEVTVPHPQTH